MDASCRGFIGGFIGGFSRGFIGGFIGTMRMGFIGGFIGDACRGFIGGFIGGFIDLLPWELEIPKKKQKLAANFRFSAKRPKNCTIRWKYSPSVQNTRLALAVWAEYWYS